MDLASIARRELGEPFWRDANFSRPAVAGIEELARRVEAIDTWQGKPIFRLDWLPDVWVMRRGVRQRAYVFEYALVTTRKVVGVPIPRWGIRQLVPDHIAAADWQRHRRAWYQASGEDYLGELPPEGLYREHPTHGILATHERYTSGPYKGTTCCYRKLTDEGKTCYGRYLAPTEQMVDRFEQGWLAYKASPAYRHPLEAQSAARRKLDAATEEKRQDDARAKFWQGIHDRALQHSLGIKGPIIDVGAARQKGALWTP
jgi:hypothetical protein